MKWLRCENVTQVPDNGISIWFNVLTDSKQRQDLNLNLLKQRERENKIMSSYNNQTQILKLITEETFMLEEQMKTAMIRATFLSNLGNNHDLRDGQILTALQENTDHMERQLLAATQRTQYLANLIADEDLEDIFAGEETAA